MQNVSLPAQGYGRYSSHESSYGIQALARGIRGSKWGASSDRYWATPGDVQPLSVQLDATSLVARSRIGGGAGAAGDPG
jgi:hypothetical protein